MIRHDTILTYHIIQHRICDDQMRHYDIRQAEVRLDETNTIRQYRIR